MGQEATRPADELERELAGGGKENLSTKQVEDIGRFHEAVRTAEKTTESVERLTRQLEKIQAERAKEVPAFNPATERSTRFLSLQRDPKNVLAREGYSFDVDSREGRERKAMLIEPSIGIDGKRRADMDTLSEYEAAIKQTAFELKWVHEYKRVSALATGKQYGGIETLDTYRKLEGLIQLADHWDGTTGEGLQWKPTLISSMLIDFFQLEPVIAAQFAGNYVTIPRGTGNYALPVETTANVWDVIRSATVTQALQTGLLVASAGQPDTGQVLLEPALHRGGITMDMDIEEDAALDVLAAARRALQRNGALAWDDAILNGQRTVDDAALDGANATEAADGAYNGLRHYAHVTNVNQTNLLGAVFESNDVKAMRAGMKKFAVNPTRLRLIMSPSAYLTLVHDTADQNVTTVEKYGSAATIVTGEVARVWGIPVIPTDRMAENMGSDGDIAATGTTTGVILVNVDRWFPGIKRQMEIRMVPSPAHDQMGVYGFIRTALDSAPPDTDDHTWYTHNVALS